MPERRSQETVAFCEVLRVEKPQDVLEDEDLGLGVVDVLHDPAEHLPSPFPVFEALPGSFVGEWLAREARRRILLELPAHEVAEAPNLGRHVGLNELAGGLVWFTPEDLFKVPTKKVKRPMFRFHARA